MKPDLIVHALSEPSERSWFTDQARRFIAYVFNKSRSQDFTGLLTTARLRYNLQAHIFEHIRDLFAGGEITSAEVVKQLGRACSVFDCLLMADFNSAKSDLRKWRAKYIKEGRAGWMYYFAITHHPNEMLGGMDDVSWYRAAQNNHPTLRWDPEACIELPPALKPKPLTGRLTRSQRDVFDALGEFWSLLRERQIFAGVRVREKPLIVAPTGSGKSHCVKEFARMNSLPMLELEPSSWVPTGARYERYTSSDIHSFVKKNDNGIIFLDEVDKLVAHGEYMTGVRQEIYSLMDGARRGYTMFSDDEREKLRRSFLIVGAGTWQECFSARPLGFQDRRSPVTIEKQDKIPEEFLRRFGEVLYLHPPGKDEFEQWIRDLYVELLLSPVDYGKLAQQAVDSGLNCRWMENHLTTLLRDPVVLEKRTDQNIRKFLALVPGNDSDSKEPVKEDLPF